MWFCKALEKEREEADKELAALDPNELHPAIRHGVAPAMSSKLKGAFWGGSLEGKDNATKKLLGYVPEGLTPFKIRSITDKCKAEWTAREVIQNYTGSWGDDEMEKPTKMEGGSRAPEAPNGYSDGSLKNPIGNHWAIGGIGVWWPNRSEESEPLNPQELSYTEYEWKWQGCLQWASSMN